MRVVLAARSRTTRSRDWDARRHTGSIPVIRGFLTAARGRGWLPPRLLENAKLAVEPAEDVVLGDLPSETPNPPAAIVLVQLQRELERPGEPVDVEGIARHRLTELVRGAGELAQNERAAFSAGVLADDELLGYEIHSVSQGCDDARVGKAVIGQQSFEAHAAVEVVDRNIGAGQREEPVDAADELLHLRAQLPVLADVAAARYGDLDEAETAAEIAPVLEEKLDCAETLDDPLRVVEAIDAEKDPPTFELRAKP